MTRMAALGWICQRCSRRLAQAARPLIRHASSEASRGAAISPALLARARAAASEHTKLSAQLTNAFDTNSAKRAGELAPIAEALTSWQSASDALKELDTLIHDPATDEELRQLANDDLDSAGTQVEAAGAALTSALVPQHPFGELPCLIEIRPGVGGSEAALFAGDLLRMYMSFCARRGLSASLLKYEDAAGANDPSASDAPLQEAIIEISTPGAYDILRTEAGVHRVQRVPATESKGRTHTSAASVLVLPALPASAADAPENTSDPESDYYVSAADVRTDVMRARGAGGQHVNTTDSAVRLTHVPTNTVVAVQDSRSQHQNRAKAWLILRARLAQARREAREAEVLAMRRGAQGHGKTGRGDKVRTYNWGQQRVTDHRSGLTLNALDGVLGGGASLDAVMDSVRAWQQERDIEGMLAEAEESGGGGDTKK